MLGDEMVTGDRGDPADRDRSAAALLPLDPQAAEALRESHDKLVELVETASAVDIRSFEDKPTSSLLEELEPTARAHVEEGLELSRQVFFLSDEWEQKTSPGTFDGSSFEMEREFDFEIDKLIGEESNSDRPLDRVADIAFIVKTELKDRQLRLAALTPESDRWQVIVECDGALRRVRKSLAALEQVLAEARNEPCRLGFQTELEVSLQIRQAYVRFRRAVTGSGAPTEETIFSRLRAAGTHIAMLVGREIYAQLRVRDRAQIREFQARILAWLRESDTDVRAGMRLWQDLVGVIDIFCQVSRRQEVVEHDSRIVAQVYEHLFDGAPAEERVSDAALTRLKLLEGLDEEIDLLLATDRRHVAAAWKEPLDRLRVHFGLVPASSPSTLDAIDDGDFF